MDFFEKIKAGLIRTREGIGHFFDQLFVGELNDDLHDELGETLVPGGMGVDITVKTAEELRCRAKVKKIRDMERTQTCLYRALTDMFQVGGPVLKLDTTSSVALPIGVNGVDKTTTIDGLSAWMKGEGHRVLMVAADTFRTAAADQLKIWSEHNGVEPVRQYGGADPMTTVFDIFTIAGTRSVDVVLVDTAGWLHNKQNLISKLNKVSRAVDRELPGCNRETLLMLDTTTEQNGLIQAKQFKEVADITGVALIKLDGSAKDGIVTTIAQEPQVLVKFTSAGGDVDDLMSSGVEELVEASV